MRRIFRRPIAVILILVVLVVSCGTIMFAMPREHKFNANKKLLDSLIKDRPWVLESLVYGNIADNPYSQNPEVNTNGSTFLKTELLDNYQESKLLKGLVSAIEVYENPKEYLAQLTEEEIELLSDAFGVDTSDSLANAIDGWLNGIDELRYESILNDVLLSNYTSTYGSSLFDTDLKLETLRQRAAVYNKLSSYQTALSTHLNLTNKQSSIIIYDPTNFVEDEYEITTEDYVNNMLGAYDENLKTYLEQSINLPGLEGKSALKGKMLSTSALAMSLACEYAVGNDNSSVMHEMFREYLCDDVVASLDALGSVLDLESYSVNQAIMLEALVNQKNTTVDTMKRLSDISTDKNMEQMLMHYVELCEKQGDTNTLSYDNVVAYLKNQNTVPNLMEKLAKKGVTSFLQEPLNYNGCSDYVLSNTIADGLSKSAAVVSLGVWLGDQITGIKGTSKSIFLCKSVDRLIDNMAALYSQDLEAYNRDKTEKNAEKVINDLELLKKLRLYGEKVAVNASKSQLDSWIGALLSDDSDLASLESRYQANIDLLLGCDISPVGNTPLNLSQGESLKVYYDDVSKPYTTMGICQKDKEYFYPEVEYQLLGGVALNGGTLSLTGLSEKSIYIPNITCTGNSTIELEGENIAIGNINNTGNLNIHVSNNGKPVTIAERLTNQGTVIVTGEKGQNDQIEVYMLDNNSQLNLQDITCQIKGNMSNNGVVTGNIELCGNGDQPYDNGYFQYGVQCLTGNGTITSLTFNNTTKDGVKVGGRQTVTGRLENSSTKVVAGKNIVVTGNCSIKDNYYNAAVTLKDYKSINPLKLKGDTYIEGDVTLQEESVVMQRLFLANLCQSLTLEKDLLVKDDLQYSSGKLKGGGWLKLCGDMNSTASSPAIEKLCFSGTTPQKMEIASALKVKDLNSINSSKEGVSFDGMIEVTGKLYAGDKSSYKNGKNIVMTESAVVVDNRIIGNISARNWTCSRPVEVEGNLYTEDVVNINNNATLEVKDYRQKSGELNIETGSKLLCGNNYINNGTANNHGVVVVTEDSSFRDTQSGGRFTFKGDVSGMAELFPAELEFEGKTGQSFSNSGETTVKSLTINNKSKDGFYVGSVINVTEQFNNNCSKIVNGKNIKLRNSANYFSKGVSKGDVTITGDFLIDSNTPMTINGNLYVDQGAELQIPSGCKLVVKQGMISSSGIIYIDQNGKLQINDYWKSQKDTVEVDGDLIVKGDADFYSSIINAAGLISFKGDVRVSSGTWNNPNISFVGKLPQNIYGDSVNVNNLTFDNESKAGVDIQAIIYCYGNLLKNATVISHEENLKQK